ncbi:MAG: 16S rRNA (guanine(527)-N(7))-methyltransferase RsmG [gamma proteobacterium symbiont of Bathyaustriella thionipta]|nr:16S rRNA (guanine(527)-N(7))-methyltransferase RsmG [gamma proteobacterium symbiont of Bathyaustriella thionipta]
MSRSSPPRQLWQQQIGSGLQAMNIAADEQQQQQLVDFLALLARWNRVYNLTAVRDQKQWVSRHLLDSLSILTLLQGKTVLDMGSGAGLPGIPLAILSPQRRFVLLDANGKKTRFMQQAQIELKLAQVKIEQQRIENYAPTDKFDTITARAFSDMDFLQQTAWPLLNGGGCLLAMKGREDEIQISPFAAAVGSPRIVALQVPQESAQRHAVIMRKQQRAHPLLTE